MKKVFIILMLSLVAIFTLNQTVLAEAVIVNEPAVNQGGLWHVEDGNRAYVYMRYTNDGTVIETGNFPAGRKPGITEYDEYATNPDGNDYSQYTYWPDYIQSDFNFPNTTNNKTATLENPNPSIYDTFVVEIVSRMTSEWRYVLGPPEYKHIKTYSEVVNYIQIDLYDHDDLDCYLDNSYISLKVNDEELISSRTLSPLGAETCGIVGEENPYHRDLSFGIRMYWEKSDTAQTINPVGTDNPWDELPETTGSPVTPIGDWGTVSSLEVQNQTVSFDIIYQGMRYPISPFTVSGDLSFIDKANDIIYYTDPYSGDRIIYFNFGESLDSAILAARAITNVNEWKGEALWNLSKNEIKVTDVLTVYNYIPEVDNDGNVYSYFYMPDVPIDNLISVSAMLAYRYWDDGFLNIGELKPGEIQYKAVAAVRGEITSVNPSWVETAYTTAYISTALATVATVSGVIPGYGWAIAAGCFIIGGALNVADVNEWFAYDIQQIEHVIPNISLVNEINTYISETNPNHQFEVNTDKLYKLHLATLNEGDEVQILGDLSNITQVVWETDGEIYVVNQEHIDNPDWGGPGTLVPQGDIGNEDFEMILMIIGGIVGLVFISKMNLDKKPGLLLLIIGGVLYLLYSMGFM